MPRCLNREINRGVRLLKDAPLSVQIPHGVHLLVGLQRVYYVDMLAEEPRPKKLQTHIRIRFLIAGTSLNPEV